jgi:hypothetical protein
VLEERVRDNAEGTFRWITSAWNKKVRTQTRKFAKGCAGGGLQLDEFVPEVADVQNEKNIRDSWIVSCVH